MSGKPAAAVAPAQAHPPASPEAMLPSSYLVTHLITETADSVTLRLGPAAAALPPFRPGQFTMLCKPGIGEVAISISGDPAAGDGTLTQTIRNVGAVSRALCKSRPGDLIGVRGPFGTSWDLDPARGDDLLIVAGGVGLAPLRPVLLGVLIGIGNPYRRDDGVGPALIEALDAVRLAEVLGRCPGRLVIFAVEAADLGFGPGLSPDVAASLPRLTRVVRAEFGL